MSQSTGSGKVTPFLHGLQHLLQRGFEALEAGRFKEAGECCRKVLSAKPDLVEGHFLVGLVARAMKDRRTAISAFGSVTKLKPDHGAAYAHLAQIFMQAGQANRGHHALAKAVQFASNDPNVQSLIGSVYFLLGEQEASHQWHSRAVACQPDNTMFIINHANSLVFLGQLERAEANLKKALELQPDNPRAHWILSNVRTVKSHKHIVELKRLVSQDGLSAEASAFLHYAMGKELEDLQQWKEAFEAFTCGALARRSVVEFDEPAEIDMFQALEEVYTPQWLQQKTPGHDDPSPIFIVGQPRTGTTLVERVITSHSQVHSAGELQQFSMCMRRMLDYREPNRYSAELVRRAAALDGAELGRLYFDTTRKIRGSLPRFVDKMPSNFLYIPLILNALPAAKIIHLVRQPMDACFSGFKQLFADAYPHSYDQREMARHHARYLRLMSSWRKRFPGRFFDIAYEEIAHDLEPSARAIINYLELPWEDDCLAFDRQDTAVTTASAVQVREPVHTRSIGRWKKYQLQLEPLTAELEKHGISVSG